jgi:hypothetical protein
LYTTIAIIILFFRGELLKKRNLFPGITLSNPTKRFIPSDKAENTYFVQKLYKIKIKLVLFLKIPLNSVNIRSYLDYVDEETSKAGVKNHTNLI